MQADIISLARHTGNRPATLAGLGDIFDDVSAGLQGVQNAITGGVSGSRGLQTATAGASGIQTTAEAHQGETWQISGSAVIDPNTADYFLGLGSQTITTYVISARLQSRLINDLGVYFDNVDAKVTGSASNNVYFITCRGRLRSDYAYMRDVESIFQHVIEMYGTSLTGVTFQRIGGVAAVTYDASGNITLPVNAGPTLSDTLNQWVNSLASGAGKGLGAGVSAGAFATAATIGAVAIAGLVLIKIAGSGSRR